MMSSEIKRAWLGILVAAAGRMMAGARSVSVGVAVLAVAVIGATTADAQTISLDEAHLVCPADSSSYYVSINNSEGFIRNSGGTNVADLTGLILDYAFPENPGYSGAADICGPLSDGGAGARGLFSFWTETMDPSTDPPLTYGGDAFGAPPAHTNNISTLSAGSMWLLDGNYKGNITVDARLQDSDGVLPDIVMQHVEPVDPLLRGPVYAFKISFADAADYEELVWTTDSGRFGGVIVTAPGETPPAEGGEIYVKSVVIASTNTVGEIQWQSSANSSTWNDIAAATSAELDVTDLWETTPWFRVETTSGTNAPAYSDSFKVSQREGSRGMLFIIE